MTNKALDLIRAQKFHDARMVLLEMNPVDIAVVFDEMEPEDIVMLFRLLPKELAADTFAYMTPEVQEKLLSALTDVELRLVLDSQFMDDTVDMLEEMPANVVRRVLKLSDPETRSMLNRLLQYEEGSAGSIMTTEYVALKKGMSIRQAIDYLKKNAVDSETLYTCYVTDQNRILEGVITVREMLLAENDALVGDVMEEKPMSVSTNTSDEEVGQMFQKYDMLALPVVDGENRLVGIITVDDAVDVIQEANTEDFEKMAALEPSETPYLKTSAFTHARKRVVWLLFLMLSGIITGQIISHYEDAFAALPILVSFIPMLMDTGGNCGSQSSTLIIRGMALEEIRPRDILKVIWKECRVSVLVGVVLAPVNILWIWLRYHSLPVAFTVGISMFITIFIAKLMGCLLPMIAKRCKLDPAIMASPLITTVVDACSIFVYFNVALLILHI
ncbi:MAG: magnesium transporter [Candidatus Merdivicinus sp.]|jgi:magnesium transporter